MSEKLSYSQEKVLQFMLDYFHRNDQLPSAAAIRDHFGWASENAVVSYWRILERKKWIARNECGKWKFVRHAMKVA